MTDGNADRASALLPWWVKPAGSVAALALCIAVASVVYCLPQRVEASDGQGALAISSVGGSGHSYAAQTLAETPYSVAQGGNGAAVLAQASSKEQVYILEVTVPARGAQTNVAFQGLCEVLDSMGSTRETPLEGSGPVQKRLVGEKVRCRIHSPAGNSLQVVLKQENRILASAATAEGGVQDVMVASP